MDQKLGFQSDFLKATVRNMTTDSEIKPSLLDLFSMTSSFWHKICPVISWNYIWDDRSRN